RVHRVRPVARNPLVAFMKISNRIEPDPARLAPDVIHRDEAVVVVERRVFHAFGHHAAGELLPPHDELEPLVTLSADVRRRLDEQYELDEVEQSRIDLTARPVARICDRSL